VTSELSMVYRFRKKKYQSTIESMAWKIAYGDLEFRNPGSTTGSKVNTASTLPH